MGLLDGRLTALFGRAFKAIYLDATLHKTTLTKTASGGFTASFTDHAVKAQIDDWTQSYKARSGIPQTDIRILVLQDCVPVSPTQDDEITVRKQRYRITGPVRQDEAQTNWDIQARPDGS